MSQERLPKGAYAALEGLQAQAVAAATTLSGNNTETVAAGRKALATAHAQMAKHPVWVNKIVKALMNNKSGITVQTADADWLAQTFTETTDKARKLLNTTIHFDPNASKSAPNTTAVEILLGGVGRLMFPDGTEQFVDDDAEPALIYSPRLKPGDLERFCEQHLDHYERFHQAHEERLMNAERVAMQAFW